MSLARALIEAEDPKHFLKRVAQREDWVVAANNTGAALLYWTAHSKFPWTDKLKNAHQMDLQEFAGFSEDYYRLNADFIEDLKDQGANVLGVLSAKRDAVEEWINFIEDAGYNRLLNLVFPERARMQKAAEADLQRMNDEHGLGEAEDPKRFLKRSALQLEIKLLVALAVEAAELVLPIFKKAYPEDDRPRKAIEAAKMWLETGSDASVRAASAAANSAFATNTRAAANAASAAAYAASYAAYAAAYAAAFATNGPAATYAPASASNYAASAAYSAANAARAAATDPAKVRIDAIVQQIEQLRSNESLRPVERPVGEAEDPKAVFKAASARENVEYNLREFLTGNEAIRCEATEDTAGFWLHIFPMYGADETFGPFRRYQVQLFRDEWLGFRNTRWTAPLNLFHEAENPKNIFRRAVTRAGGWSRPMRLIQANLKDNPQVYAVEMVKSEQGTHVELLKITVPGEVEIHPFGPFTEEEVRELMRYPTLQLVSWSYRDPIRESEDPKRFLQQHGRDFSYGSDGTIIYVTPLNGAAKYFLDTVMIPNQILPSDGTLVMQPEYLQQFLAQAGEAGLVGRRVKLEGAMLQNFRPFYETVADDIAKEADKAEEPKSPEHAEAGNYRKGHIHLHGLGISIENAKGSIRKSKDPDNPWQVKMPCHYGYIKGTVGKDKDHIDVYIGEHPTSMLAFIVNQVKKEGGAFDEHKIMLGFKTKDEAIAAYDRAFTGDLGPKLRKEVISATIDQVKTWLEKGDTKKEYANLAESQRALTPRQHPPEALESEDPKAVFRQLRKGLLQADAMKRWGLAFSKPAANGNTLYMFELVYGRNKFQFKTFKEVEGVYAVYMYHGIHGLQWSDEVEAQTDEEAIEKAKVVATVYFAKEGYFKPLRKRQSEARAIIEAEGPKNL